MLDGATRTKLQNILKLANEGATEGEREAAQLALEKLCAKYEVDMHDITPDFIPHVKVYLNYANKFEKELAEQCLAVVCFPKDAEGEEFNARYGTHKKKLFTTLPANLAAELELRYSMYKKELDKTLDNALYAFYIANDIFPETSKMSEEAKAYKHTPEEIEQARKAAAMAQSIDRTHTRAQIQNEK